LAKSAVSGHAQYSEVVNSIGRVGDGKEIIEWTLIAENETGVTDKGNGLKGLCPNCPLNAW
jgi:hypothetical protein